MSTVKPSIQIILQKITVGKKRRLRGVFRIFSGAGTKFRHFLNIVFFPGRVNFKQLK